MRLFQYEIAREPDARKSDLAKMMQNVFGEWFPRTPYLKIPPAVRRGLLKNAFSPTSGVPLYDVLEPRGGLDWTYDYSFAEGEPATPEERATAKRDETKATVTLNVDLDYPDGSLLEQFKTLLNEIRRNKHTCDGRKSVKLGLALKELGSARLLRLYGTPERARNVLFEEGYGEPYKADSGWYKAKTNVVVWSRNPPWPTLSGHSLLVAPKTRG